MLDLTQLDSFYEFKWFDGSIVHLPKPPEKLLRKAAALQSENMGADVDYLEEVKKIAWELIRNNTDGRKFTKAELEKCDFTVSNMLLTDYLEAVTKRLGE